MLGFMNKFQDLDEPPQLKSYLQRQLEAQYRIDIGSAVSYNRAGAYSFQNGVVNTVDPVRQIAVVTWQDENGWHHQRPCGIEYLRKESKTLQMSAQSVS